ncbi:MAG: hypothetical protein PHQ36_06360 [Anaerolineales bacterium]|nr:hypothetical protein [Anaerolineales bacterium]
MSVTDSVPQICPFLGLEDDADSSLAFPSDSNYCHRSAPISPVKTNYQREFCLSGKHRQCLVFSRRQIGPLPDHIRAKKNRAGETRKISQRNIIAVLIALIVIFMLEWQSLTQTKSQPPETTATPTLYALPTKTPTQTLAPTLPPPTLAATSTPTLHIPFFGSVTVTSSPTATPSLTPTVFISRHQIDVPIGTDKKFIIHRLAYKENLDPYVEKYNTSIEAVVAINYYLYLTNPVKRDVLIVFPIGFADVSGLPTLAIYQITEKERGINYEDLAWRLRIETSDLKYYNGVTDPNDRPLVGDYFLIPQKRLVP